MQTVSRMGNLVKEPAIKSINYFVDIKNTVCA